MVIYLNKLSTIQTRVTCVVLCLFRCMNMNVLQVLEFILFSKECCKILYCLLQFSIEGDTLLQLGLLKV